MNKQIIDLKSERSEYRARHGGLVREIESIGDETVSLKKTVSLLEEDRARLTQLLEAQRATDIERDAEMARLVSINEERANVAGPSSYAAAASSPVRLGMDLDPTPAQAAVSHGDRGVFTSRPERIAISDPEKFSGSKNMDIRMWLKTLQRFFQDKNQPIAMYGRFAGHWLSGNALSLWECELNDLSDSGLSPTWDMFKETMISYYGTVIPAREQRAKYLKCVQSGRVMDFVTELIVIIQTLKSTDFAPSPMDVVEHFINGLKADVTKYVEDNAPQGWWTDPKPLYEKAIPYEVNQHSHATKIQAMPRVHNTVFKSLKSRKSFAGKGPARLPMARPAPVVPVSHQVAAPPALRDLRDIPQILKAQRMGARECLVCGDKNHLATYCRLPVVIPEWVKDLDRNAESRKDANSRKRKSFHQSRPN